MDYMDDVGLVGFLDPNGSGALCAECVGSMADACPLYRILVDPYKQSCSCCGHLMIKGRTPAWCELFPG